MAGLNPAIHVFVSSEKEDVDHRAKPGDDEWWTNSSQRHNSSFPRRG
jgi:hypothetical protein